jgi:cell wall-associated NlpC family hydrolase
MAWGGVTPQAVLQGLHIPVTKANVQDLLAWQRAEGGGATNNPFNTTQMASGAGSYNSVGVRNYTSAQQGLQATLQTLTNGRYSGILKALRSGNGSQFASAVGASPWGTSGSLIASVLGTKLSMPSGAGFQHPQGKGVVQAGGTRFDAATFKKQAGAILMQNAAAEENAGAQALAQGQLPGTQTQVPGDSIMQQLEQARQAAMVKVTRSGQVKTGLEGVRGVPQGNDPGSKAVQMALKQIGVPYVWGGENAKGKAGGPGAGFDCSGLVQFAYGALGIHLPRTAAEQGSAGKRVSYNNLKPGDLLVENNGDHVVMYAGNGKVIQAPHTGTSVQMSPMSWFPDSQYYAVRPY